MRGGLRGRDFTGASKERMLFCAVGELVFSEHFGVFERRHAMPEIADTDLNSPVEQQLFELARRAHENRKPHRLIARAKTPNRLADARARRYRRVPDHADGERADQLAADVARLHAEAVDGIEQRASGIDELRAARAQAKAAAAAFA